MFIPPLGYMLKFSGSADLHEHVHPTLCGIVSVFTNMYRSGEESTEVSLDIRATAHCRVNTVDAPILKSSLAIGTHTNHMSDESGIGIRYSAVQQE